MNIKPDTRKWWAIVICRTNGELFWADGNGTSMFEPVVFGTRKEAEATARIFSRQALELATFKAVRVKQSIEIEMEKP